MIKTWQRCFLQPFCRDALSDKAGKHPICVASLVTWPRFVQSLQSKRAQQQAYFYSGIQKREAGAGKSVDYFFYIYLRQRRTFLSVSDAGKKCRRKTVSKIVTLNNGNGQLLLGNLSSVSRKYCESFFMFNLSFFMKCYFVLLRTTDSRNGATSCTCPRG